MATANKYAQEQMEKMSKAANDQVEEISSFGRNGFDAWMKSTNVLFEGTGEMMKSWTSMTSKVRENNLNAVKELMACKTLSDITETSAKLAQESFEDGMNCATEISEKSIKIYMSALEPLNEQASTSFRKMTSKAQKAA